MRAAASSPALTQRTGLVWRARRSGETTSTRWKNSRRAFASMCGQTVARSRRILTAAVRRGSGEERCPRREAMRLRRAAKKGSTSSKGTIWERTPYPTEAWPPPRARMRRPRFASPFAPRVTSPVEAVGSALFSATAMHAWAKAWVGKASAPRAETRVVGSGVRTKNVCHAGGRGVCSGGIVDGERRKLAYFVCLFIPPRVPSPESQETCGRTVSPVCVEWCVVFGDWCLVCGVLLCDVVVAAKFGMCVRHDSRRLRSLCVFGYVCVCVFGYVCVCACV